jgi:hypothetical protein
VIRRETIGAEDCPLFHRWTLLGWDRGKGRGSRFPFKVMIHHFLPDGLERDEHDHPWDFLTVVLRGAYLDMGPEGREWVSAPGLRLRRAEHRHRTMTDARGAWTLVLARRPRRPWFFYGRDGRRWPWREYVQRHGGERC